MDKINHTYSHSRNTLLIDTVLNAAIHTLEVPPNEVPADVQGNLLALRHGTRCQSCKVAEVSWVEKGI